MPTGGEATFELRTDTSGLQRGMEEGKQIAQRGATDISDTFGRIIEIGLGVAAGQTITGVLRSAVSGATQAIFGLNAGLQTATVQMTTFTGSADKAATRVSDLMELAGDFSFPHEQVISASLALERFGGAALDTDEFLTQMGDASAATGMGLQTLATYFGRLYGAVQEGQPLQFYLTRLQRMGVVTPEVVNRLKAMQKAGADADTIWATLTGSLDRFSGTMERSSSTWNTSVMKFKENVEELSATAFKPLFDVANRGMVALNDALADPRVAGTMKDIASGLGEGIDEVTSALDALYDTGSAIAEKFEPVIDLFERLGISVETLAEEVPILVAAWATWKAGFLIEGLASTIANMNLLEGATRALTGARAVGGAVAGAAATGDIGETMRTAASAATIYNTAVRATADTTSQMAGASVDVNEALGNQGDVLSAAGNSAQVYSVMQARAAVAAGQMAVATDQATVAAKGFTIAGMGLHTIFVILTVAIIATDIAMRAITGNGLLDWLGKLTGGHDSAAEAAKRQAAAEKELNEIVAAGTSKPEALRKVLDERVEAYTTAAAHLSDAKKQLDTVTGGSERAITLAYRGSLDNSDVIVAADKAVKLWKEKTKEAAEAVADSINAVWDQLTTAEQASFYATLRFISNLSPDLKKKVEGPLEDATDAYNKYAQSSQEAAAEQREFQKSMTQVPSVLDRLTQTAKEVTDAYDKMSASVSAAQKVFTRETSEEGLLNYNIALLDWQIKVAKATGASDEYIASLQKQRDELQLTKDAADAFDVVGAEAVELLHERLYENYPKDAERLWKNLVTTVQALPPKVSTEVLTKFVGMTPEDVKKILDAIEKDPRTAEIELGLAPGSLGTVQAKIQEDAKKLEPVTVRVSIQSEVDRQSASKVAGDLIDAGVPQAEMIAAKPYLDTISADEAAKALTNWTAAQEAGHPITLALAIYDVLAQEALNNFINRNKGLTIGLAADFLLPGWVQEIMRNGRPGGGGPGAGGITITPVGGTISQGFGVTPFSGHYASGIHTGVDIAAPTGTPIAAAVSGHVENAGWQGGYGNAVTIDSEGGLTELYGHMSQILTDVGQQVAMGQLIGRVGSTGDSTGPHVHFEVRLDGVAIDPSRFIRRAQSGAYITRHQYIEVGEGDRPELILPLSDPRRTSELMKQAGLLLGSYQEGAAPGSTVIQRYIAAPDAEEQARALIASYKDTSKAEEEAITIADALQDAEITLAEARKLGLNATQAAQLEEQNYVETVGEAAWRYEVTSTKYASGVFQTTTAMAKLIEQEQSLVDATFELATAQRNYADETYVATAAQKALVDAQKETADAQLAFVVAQRNYADVAYEEAAIQKQMADDQKTLAEASFQRRVEDQALMREYGVTTQAGLDWVKGMKEIREELDRTGETVEQFMVRVLRSQVEAAQSELGELFSNLDKILGPTREQLGIMLQMATQDLQLTRIQQQQRREETALARAQRTEMDALKKRLGPEPTEEAIAGLNEQVEMEIAAARARGATEEELRGIALRGQFAVAAMERKRADIQKAIQQLQEDQQAQLEEMQDAHARELEQLQDQMQAEQDQIDLIEKQNAIYRIQAQLADTTVLSQQNQKAAIDMITAAIRITSQKVTDLGTKLFFAELAEKAMADAATGAAGALGALAGAAAVAAGALATMANSGGQRSAEDLRGALNRGEISSEEFFWRLPSADRERLARLLEALHAQGKLQMGGAVLRQGKFELHPGEIVMQPAVLARIIVDAVRAIPFPTTTRIAPITVAPRTTAVSQAQAQPQPQPRELARAIADAVRSSQPQDTVIRLEGNIELPNVTNAEEFVQELNRVVRAEVTARGSGGRR